MLQMHGPYGRKRGLQTRIMPDVRREARLESSTSGSILQGNGYSSSTKTVKNLAVHLCVSTVSCACVSVSGHFPVLHVPTDDLRVTS
jgi:hypothetical protein